MAAETRNYIRQALRQLAEQDGDLVGDYVLNICRRRHLDVNNANFSLVACDCGSDEVVIFTQQSYCGSPASQKFILRAEFERVLQQAVQFGRSIFFVRLTQHFRRLKESCDFAISSQHYIYYKTHKVSFEHREIKNPSSILRSGAQHTREFCQSQLAQQRRDLEWVFSDGGASFFYFMFLKWQLLQGREMRVRGNSAHAGKFLRQATMNSLLILQMRGSSG